MKVPLGWLKEYVEFDASPAELAAQLTMTGVAVEGWECENKGLTGAVVGKILSVEPHPSSDHLLVCTVDVGDRKVSIVTGAQNVSAGQYVPVALPGARLPDGQEIGVAVFRGVESVGMLLSAKEMGFDQKVIPKEEQDGIFILPGEDYTLGEDIVQTLNLNEVVLEIETYANRPDHLSVIGIAREVAALYNKPLRLPVLKKSVKGGEVAKRARVEVRDETLCPRYMAKMVEDIKVAPSPLWLQRRLQGCGVRPINSIVDITNYVMLEYGQPLHAFDFHLLTDQRIVVRRADDGETIRTLDGTERTLTPEDLVIADGRKPVAVAGVMGGENSEVLPETKVILLESANFHPVSVRRTARRLGLRTEASARFEKGLDPNLAELAAERAVSLLTELGFGREVEGALDLYPHPVEPRVIELSPEKVNGLLGTDLSPAEMKVFLKRLHFGVDEKSDRIAVPTFRSDISGGADLAEEVARLYGLNQISATLPAGKTTQGKRTFAQQLEDKVRELLVAGGLHEVLTYSFVHPNIFDKLALPESHPRRLGIKLMNPLTEDRSLMRTLLFPSLLEIAARNQSRKVENIRLFELAHIYLPKVLPLTDLPDERLTIAGLIVGDEFFTLKGIVENLLTGVGVINGEFKPYRHPSFHPGRTAQVMVGDQELGIIGELHPDVLENFELTGRAVACELDFRTLAEVATFARSVKPLPRFPGVSRDFAFVVDDHVLAAEVARHIRRVGGDLVADVRLFDVYKGSQLPAGKKSMAYTVLFQAPDRTLTDEEVRAEVEAIRAALQKEFGAELRG